MKLMVSEIFEFVCYCYCLGAVRTDGYHAYRNARHLLYLAHISLCCLRQLLERLTGAGDILFPPPRVQSIQACTSQDAILWKGSVENLAVALISGADAYLVKT